MRRNFDHKQFVQKLFYMYIYVYIIKCHCRTGTDCSALPSTEPDIISDIHPMRNFTIYTFFRFARLGEYIRSEKNAKCFGSYCHVRVKHKVDEGFKPRLFHNQMLWNDIAILRLEKPVVYRGGFYNITSIYHTKGKSNYILFVCFTRKH